MVQWFSLPRQAEEEAGEKKEKPNPLESLFFDPAQQQPNRVHESLGIVHVLQPAIYFGSSGIVAVVEHQNRRVRVPQLDSVAESNAARLWYGVAQQSQLDKRLREIAKEAVHFMV
jgi:hypothetical protein